MHILFAVHGYKPAYRIGGPIYSVSATAEALVRRGHRVTVFTTNSNLDEDLDVRTDEAVGVEGVEVWYFRREAPLKKYLPFIPYFSKSMGYLYTPGMRGALERIIATVDVVHTHMPFIYPTSLVGRAAIRSGIPLFYNQRGVFDPERLKFRALKKRLYLGFVERAMLKEAACLIALTDAEVESYRALGVATPCEVIPNGIHVSEYWQDVSSEWQERLAIPEGAQVILFMGRLHPIKGADRVVRAFASIHHKHPRSLLVCAGPDEFGIQRRLADLIRQDTSCAQAVRFCGMVSGDLKKALLARADLFCLPSDAEGFSMAVLEAMASKTAVLISPECHFERVAQVNAGVVIGKDVDSVAGAMDALLADPSRLAEMGGNALRLVQNEYRWGPLVDKLVSVYERYSQRERR